MHWDTECPFCGITNYGRIWRKGMKQQGLECALVLLFFFLWSNRNPIIVLKKERKKDFFFFKGLLQSGGPWHKCVDGLGLNDFLGQVIPASGGSRQEWVLLPCWYWVLQCGCENCWLCLWWHGGGGWSLFLIPSVAMMLWILYSIANRAVLNGGPLLSVLSSLLQS